MSGKAKNAIDSIYEGIRRGRIIAIVRSSVPESIVPIAEALLAGGIGVMEYCCPVGKCREAMREVAGAMGDRMIIGAGNVMSVECARDAFESGASFASAPDTNPEVVSFCLESGIPVIPGASTPTEIIQAKRLGASMVKLFPAGALGTEYLREIRGPIRDVELIAAGGINTNNAAQFIEGGCVAVGVAGSMVSAQLAGNSDWEGLTHLARIYTGLVSCNEEHSQ